MINDYADDPPTPPVEPPENAAIRAFPVFPFPRARGAEGLKWRL